MILPAILYLIAAAQTTFTTSVNLVDYTYVPSTGVITFIPTLAGGEVIKIRWFD